MVGRFMMLIILVTVIAAFAASASTIGVDGGTIQVFEPGIPARATPLPVDVEVRDNDDDRQSEPSPVVEDRTVLPEPTGAS